VIFEAGMLFAIAPVAPSIAIGEEHGYFKKRLCLYDLTGNRSTKDLR